MSKEDKNYRKAKVLDKKGVKNHFSKNGYNVLDLQQLWRHMHGKLEKDNKVFFFKMASTPDIGERTQNETSWNQQIHRLVKESGIYYFNVPEIYDTGEYEGKFYYLSSYHEGTMLASKNPPYTDGLDRWLNRIVKSNLFFLSLENLSLPRDRGQKGIDKEWDKFIKKIKSRHQEVEEHQLQEVLEEVHNLKNTYEQGVNHGDFVPWHMIHEGDRFVLIDGEHASAQSPKYYDICYFYHRLYTSAQNPELAKLYLNKLRSSLPKSEKNKLDLSIRPILAARIISGFWDAQNDNQVCVAYHKDLKEDFLKNKLL